MSEPPYTCGICLDSTSGRTRLSACCHSFHFSCIARWAQVLSTQTASHCPTCRTPFTYIRKVADGLVVKEKTLEPRWDSDSEYEDAWLRCQICGSSDHEGMLQCGGEGGSCPNMYHLRCLGLTSMPSALWLCADCRSMEAYHRIEVVNAELQDSINDSYGSELVSDFESEDLYEGEDYHDSWSEGSE